MARISWYQEKVGRCTYKSGDLSPGSAQCTIKLKKTLMIILVNQILFMPQIGAYDQQVWEKSLEQTDLNVSLGGKYAKEDCRAYLNPSRLTTRIWTVNPERPATSSQTSSMLTWSEVRVQMPNCHIRSHHCFILCRVHIQQSETTESLDSVDSQGFGPSAAASLLLSVVDSGHLQDHLLMHSATLLYARLTTSHTDDKYNRYLIIIIICCML